MPSKFKETVFEDSYTSFINDSKTKGIVEIDEVLKLVSVMQENEMDCHIIIAGQNGSGKSFLELMIGKKKNKEKLFTNYFMADKTTNDIIQFLLSNEKATLCIDEMNLYLNYKQHASSEQNHLINMLELARSKEIAIIGCIRDPRKLTLNYRDGKMSIILWVLDRFKDKSGAYAAILVGNPSLEGEDRFGITWLDIRTPDFEDMRSQLENLPSFVGYLKIPSAKTVLTDQELKDYKKYKNEAMAHAHLNQCLKRLKNKKMDMDEFSLQVEELKKVLGEEIVESKLLQLKSKTKTLKQFLEDD